MVTARHSLLSVRARYQPGKLSLGAIIRLMVALLLSLASIAHANTDDGLQVSTDRQSLDQNESLELTISSQLALSNAFSLFDLNTLNIEAPDVTAIETDFEVLDRRQNYRVQIVNNENQSVIVWTYTLLPRRSGSMEIPALNWEGHTSAPIPIEVRPATTGSSLSEQPVSLEIDLEADKAYIGQQILLTVKLRYLHDLIQGELDHPDHNDALFRQLGKQREFQRYENGQYVKVFERRYAVFPRKTGELTLPQLRFRGQFLEPRTGRRVTRETLSEERTLTVLPPAEEFSGDTWLPAQGLSIQQAWKPDVFELQVGESLSRELDLQVLGLEGVAIPKTAWGKVAGLKSYVESPQINTEDSDSGVQGLRQESATFVATQPGEHQLPDIEVVWWDVVNDLERVTRVPGRTVRVLGSGAVAGDSFEPSSMPESAVQESPSVPSTPPVLTPTPGQPQVSWAKLLIATLVGLGVGILSGWYARGRLLKTKAKASAEGYSPESPRLSVSWKEFRKQALCKPESLGDQLPLWLAAHCRHKGIPAADRDRLLGSIQSELSAVQGLRYGPTAKENGISRETPEIQNLLAALEKRLLDYEGKKEASLAPLYPGQG